MKILILNHFLLKMLNLSQKIMKMLSLRQFLLNITNLNQKIMKILILKQFLLKITDLSQQITSLADGLPQIVQDTVALSVTAAIAPLQQQIDGLLPFSQSAASAVETLTSTAATAESEGGIPQKTKTPTFTPTFFEHI